MTPQAPKPPILDDPARAALVARHVQLHDVALDSVEAALDLPREQLARMERAVTQFSDQVIRHRFDEESKTLQVTIRIEAKVIGGSNAAFHGLVPISEHVAQALHFTCQYTAIYTFHATGGPAPEERDSFFAAFARFNGTFNVWPFARELLQSTALRLGVAPITLPVRFVPTPKAPPPALPVGAAQPEGKRAPPRRTSR